MAVAERASDLDPRIWLNGSEIARVLQRSESTVYSALVTYVRASQKVGGQRRYNWIVGFELCRAYAVPWQEYLDRVRPILVSRAEERGNDPRDVLQLFETLWRRWRETGDPEVTPQMVERLWAPAGRLDAEAVAAAKLLQGIEDRPDLTGPSSLP